MAIRGHSNGHVLIWVALLMLVGITHAHRAQLLFRLQAWPRLGDTDVREGGAEREGQARRPVRVVSRQQLLPPWFVMPHSHRAQQQHHVHHCGLMCVNQGQDVVLERAESSGAVRAAVCRWRKFPG